MANPTITNCPGCGESLDYYQSAVHPKSTRPPTWIGTCKTVGCRFHEKTAADTEWLAFANDIIEQVKYADSCALLDAKHAQAARSGG